MTETTHVRIRPEDAARLEALRRRLTVLAEGEVQSTADVIHKLLEDGEKLLIAETDAPQDVRMAFSAAWLHFNLWVREQNEHEQRRPAEQPAQAQEGDK